MWTEQANCIGIPQRLFFPPRLRDTLEEPSVAEAYDEAVKVCNACEVKQECLDFALDNHIIFGCWGGKTPPERRRLARERIA